MLRRSSMIALAAFFFSFPAYAQDCTNPDGVIGQISYLDEHDRVVGCTAGAGWVAFHADTGYTPPPSDPCDGSPKPGTTCSDGSIYAGPSPDGGVAMYTTSADAPGTYEWGPAGTDTTMANCTNVTPGTAVTCRTGQANTTLLAGLSVRGGRLLRWPDRTRS